MNFLMLMRNGRAFALNRTLVSDGGVKHSRQAEIYYLDAVDHLS